MKEYIMFGAGRNAEQIIDGSIGIFPYKYIVDNDEQKQGKTIRGIKIVSPDYLISSDYNGENILISVTRDDVHCAIVEQLQGMGFKYNENFFDAAELISIGNTVSGLVSGYIELPEYASSIKSFDPSSRLVKLEDTGYMLRCVSDDSAVRYKDIFEKCLKNGLFGKYIVKTSCSGNTYGLPYKLVLEHEFVNPVSYCFEWSPKTFYDYTLFMADFLLKLSNADLGLNDGHALNTTIANGSFLFLDFGAIKQGVTRKATLIEYINTHIIPVALFGKKQAKKAYLFLKNMGLQYTAADIQGYLNQKEYDAIVDLYDLALRVNTQEDMQLFIKRARNCIFLFSDTEIRTRWEGYQNDEWDWSVNKNKWSSKMTNVMKMIEEVNPDTITDLAGNMGWYGSYMRDKLEYSVIVDMDYNCIDYLWEKIKELDIKNVIPISMSLCSPTLDYYRDDAIRENGIIPWRKNAIERFQSKMVLALAIVHHLAFAQQLTFEEIINQVALFTSQYLIIEFIEQTDQYITDFLKDGFEWYTKENFEQTLKQRFVIIETAVSTPKKTRTLYLCEKK